MAGHGSGDDDAIGRISMYLGEKARAEGNVSIDGYLDKPFIHLLFTPQADILRKSYAPFISEHSYFPERDCGNSNLVRLPCPLDFQPRAMSQSGTA
jgi:hypothetical protein